MTEMNDDYRSVEARLYEYGAVLQGHLDGTAEADEDTTGTLLIGGFGAADTTQNSPKRPVTAIVSLAAAALVLVGLLVPGLVTSDPASPVTVTGGQFAGETEDDTKPDTNGGTAADDHASTDSEVADKSATEADRAESPEDSVASEKPTAEDSDSADGESADKDATSPDDDSGAKTGDHGDNAPDADDGYGARVFTLAAGADDGPTDGDDKDGDQSDGNDKGDGTEDDKEKDGDDKGGDVEETCSGDLELRDGKCVKIGAPPTGGAEDCPKDAVVVANECYEVVPPNCGDLEVAPDGEGCLKLVGDAGASGACPPAYELTDDGESCEKHLPANVSCAQGKSVGDRCLIEKSPTGGDDGGCDGDLLQIGNQCYELTNPTYDCGELALLDNGNCRYPVDGEQATECPAGLEPWNDICYRYEDPPSYDCPAGESDGSGWCAIEEAGTPGPDVCDDGVLQDEQGCYVLVESNEGDCGELAPFEGKCRKTKPSYPTWTCSDGKTSYEPTCETWVEATATCAAGELVDANTRCKTIADPISTNGCPSYAEEDSQGCYKAKEPSISCGELAVAPDGEHCKKWVGEATGALGECPAGYELVGNSTCKKYIEGTVSCSGSELVEVKGAAKCRYTTAAGEATDGCTSDTVEKAGKCYTVIAKSCHDLDVDLYGTGCKKPVDTSGELSCDAGFTLVDDECIR